MFVFPSLRHSWCILYFKVSVYVFIDFLFFYARHTKLWLQRQFSLLLCYCSYSCADAFFHCSVVFVHTRLLFAFIINE